jgi:hypothetical protein
VQVGRAQDAVGVVAEEAETVEEGDSLRASGHGLVALRTDIGHHATVEQAVGDVAAQMAETSNQIVVRCALGADIVLRAGDTVGEVAGVAQKHELPTMTAPTMHWAHTFWVEQVWQWLLGQGVH